MKNIDSILLDEKFREYSKKIVELEKDRIFCKHDLEHSLDVARICYILTLEDGVKVGKEIIYATALLHDLGRVNQYTDGTPHDIASYEIAGDILSRTDFSENEVEMILDCIAKHRNKSNEESYFAMTFYKADKLSRMCFNCPAWNMCNWSDDKKNHSIIY